MIRWFLPLLLLVSTHAFAGFTSVDLSYTKGDYGSVYHEAGQKVLLNGKLGETNLFYLGYEHVQRDYTSEVGFARDAFLFGNTTVFKEAQSYLEFTGATAGQTKVGAQYSGSLIPHTTYFTNWDLSLGLHYAKYDTGDVQSFQPQIIYFFTDLIGIGHSSWFYQDNGWHHAHREFFRYRDGSYGAELSWAGGENREDVGFIDQFNAYSVTFNYYHKFGNTYLSLEDYQGKSRRGTQWGAGFKWEW